jgi:hypothetical protein
MGPKNGGSRLRPCSLVRERSRAPGDACGARGLAWWLRVAPGSESITSSADLGGVASEPEAPARELLDRWLDAFSADRVLDSRLAAAPSG